MQGHVDILTLSPESTFRYSLFVKRIIAIEAQDYNLWITLRTLWAMTPLILLSILGL